MSKNLPIRIAAIVNADEPIPVSARAIFDLCQEACGVSYDVDLEQSLHDDEQRLAAWLTQAGADFLHNKTVAVRSWLFGIQTLSDDAGVSRLQLEMEGHIWEEWNDENDEVVWCPREYELSLESVNKLYSINEAAAGLEWAEQNCAEYTLCLGIAAILVRSAIRQRPPGWPAGRNAYVCWAGGDYVKLNV